MMSQIYRIKLAKEFQFQNYLQNLIENLHLTWRIYFKYIFVFWMIAVFQTCVAGYLVRSAFVVISKGYN